MSRVAEGSGLLSRRVKTSAGSNPAGGTNLIDTLERQRKWPLDGMVDIGHLKCSVREDVPVRVWQGPPLREDGEMADTGDSKSPAHLELAGSSPALPTTMVLWSRGYDAGLSRRKSGFDSP